MVWGADKNGLHIITGCLNINHRCLGFCCVIIFALFVRVKEGLWQWLSKTRCEYFPVRSAPPSMAPQGFGKPLPQPSPNISAGFHAK
ncbi:hypothetical protein J122_1147 [Marinobacter excellens LAMA 842]|uniref:Uncharacterized protein n=1 Tax=Marinobacter excellens LAMA 842 TaxID=1306954 RepID=A0A137SF09_9GAMM|nr:hypothetical protein J122_1147 [Marinobacter excellens LAMA 842]